MLLLTITASLSVLAQTGASVVEAVGASVEIFAVIDRAPAIPNDWASKSDDDRATELRLATGDAAGCAFENVVFSYASRPDLRVLDGLTLRIPAKSRAVWKSISASGARDDAAVLAPSSDEEPASPRHRAGVASMA
jgi:ABC-type multidrug transport system fused ATPase/permease subunit